MHAITRMLEEDAYCIDIIRQVQAVQAALSKASVMILDKHLNSCVITAIKGEDQNERQRVLNEIMEVYQTGIKI